MQRFILFLFFVSLNIVSLSGQSSIVGVWKTVDDNTGESKSHVEIYEKDGKYYGKLVRLLLSPEDSTCDACPDDKKGQPLIGMNIIWDMEPYKDYWSNGQIMDPENGKIYKCNISLKANGELEVRGYVGFSALGRSQYWQQVK